jgi:hypothetical protein
MSLRLRPARQLSVRVKYNPGRRHIILEPHRLAMLNQPQIDLASTATLGEIPPTRAASLTSKDGPNSGDQGVVMALSQRLAVRVVNAVFGADQSD